MKSNATLRGLVATSLVACFAIASLTGCGENPVSAGSFNDSPLKTESQLTDGVDAASGKVMFEQCNDVAMSALTLSEAVRLTPYIVGTKSIEDASLSELTEITPAVVKFQNAFKAELDEGVQARHDLRGPDPGAGRVEVGGERGSPEDEHPRAEQEPGDDDAEEGSRPVRPEKGGERPREVRRGRPAPSSERIEAHGPQEYEGRSGEPLHRGLS